MAYIPSPIDEENDDPNLIRGGSSGTISGSATAARPSREQKDTNYTNVGEYVEANREGTQKLGQDIASGIQGQVGKAESAFGESIKQLGDTQQDLGAFGQIFESVKSGQAASLSPEQRAQAKRFATGEYSGAQSLSETKGYNQALDEKRKALQMLDLAEKEEGTGTLIRETIKPQQYSRGEQAFDVSLLRTEPGARKTFQELSAQKPKFEQTLKQRQTEAESAAQAQRAKFGEQQSQIGTLGKERFESIRAKDSEQALKDARDAAYNEQMTKLKEEQDYFKNLYSGFGSNKFDVNNYSVLPDREFFDESLRTNLSEQEQQELMALNEILGLDQDLEFQRNPSLRNADPQFDEERYIKDILATLGTTNVSGSPGPTLYQVEDPNYGTMYEDIFSSANDARKQAEKFDEENPYLTSQLFAPMSVGAMALRDKKNQDKIKSAASSAGSGISDYVKRGNWRI